MMNLIVMQIGPWPEVVDRVGRLGRGAEQGTLSVVMALLVMLLGWGLAALLSRLVRRLLRWVGFDAGVLRLTGGSAVSRHEPAAVAAWGLYWLVIAGAALVALETLGFDLAGSVAQRLNEVVPRVVAAAVLFTVGSVLAMFLGSVTRRFLESAEIRAARLQGQVVSAVLTGFAALVALDQLGFAAQFVMAIGVVVLAALGIGLALAFGLGCRDLARDFVVEYLRSLEDDRPQRPQ